MGWVRPKSPMAPTDYRQWISRDGTRQRAVGDGMRTHVDRRLMLDIPAFFAPEAELKGSRLDIQALAPRRLDSPGRRLDE